MKTIFLLASAGVATAIIAGCSPDKALQAANTGATTAPTATASAAAADAGPAAPPPLGRMDFAENDFVESDRNRDPFRTYIATFAPPDQKRITRNDREVVLPQYSIDELKLVAIVTGGDFPRAMVVDPNGKGHVLKRGTFVGRPEIVHIGGTNGADYQINWRVDKVRDGDIVFIREDPAQPGIPPISRVVTLHPEQQEQRAVD
ncbi:MAG: pilus assembly protein PilP [Labilithrix sp.]|nr:pilus assembly protein PilP [Labilithrix sp.]